MEKGGKLLLELGSLEDDESSVERLGFKTSRIETPRSAKQGHVYYCVLCDEALTFSRHFVDLLKVRVAFDQKCPGCGFELERVLRSEACEVSDRAGFFDIPKLGKADSPVELLTKSLVGREDGSALERDLAPRLSLGIETVDKRLTFAFGQLAVLRGPLSQAFSLLLCVRAMLPGPLGPESDVIYIDGGNLFDANAISSYAINHGISPAEANGRIHLSRAFTYHQLSSLITKKLSSALGRFQARLVVVSDITQLYCDPDVRDSIEAQETLARDMKFLRELAEKRKVLIVANAAQPRNHVMDNLLLREAHVSVEL